MKVLDFFAKQLNRVYKSGIIMNARRNLDNVLKKNAELKLLNEEPQGLHCLERNRHQLQVFLRSFIFQRSRGEVIFHLIALNRFHTFFAQYLILVFKNYHLGSKTPHAPLSSNFQFSKHRLVLRVKLNDRSKLFHQRSIDRSCLLLQNQVASYHE